MAFQEYYVVPAGTNGASNMNAGDKLTAPVTTTGGTYTQGGGAGGGTSDLFVAASGTPFSGAVAGDYVSIYTDAATTPAFIGRISTKNSSTSIDIDSTKSSGTRPASVAGKTATLGGAWLGPTGAVGHPFGFITAAATDGSGNTPRVNGVGTSNITAAMTHGNNGPIRFEGMTASAGDGGRWTIDGGTSGTSYAPLTVSGTDISLVRLTLQNNGATGSATGLSLSGIEAHLEQVVIHAIRGFGADVGSQSATLVECEFYACNTSSTSAISAVRLNATDVTLIRCVVHDNTGVNGTGLLIASSASATVIGLIADTNGAVGISVAALTAVRLIGCDCYNNTSDGIQLSNTGTGVYYLENCNLVKNGGWGINGTGSGARVGSVVNCGFGSGTQVNTSGTTTGLKSIVESGSVTYASGVTPWVDPANGDFRINLAAAKGAGRGSFTQTAASYAGAVAYPDIGAAQHADVGTARIIGG